MVFLEFGLRSCRKSRAAGAGIGDREQAIVEPHFRRHRVRRRRPSGCCPSPSSARRRRAAARFGQILAVHGGHVAVGVLLAAGALHDEAVAQPHLVARKQAEVALGRLSRKSSRSIHSSRENGMLRLPSSGFCGWLGASHISSLPCRIVVDHELDRIEHARCGAARARSGLRACSLRARSSRSRNRTWTRRCARRTGESPRACSRGGARRPASACADRPSRRRAFPRRAGSACAWTARRR